MQELEGLELADFWQRALAFGIDFLSAGLVFAGAVLGVASILSRYHIWDDRHIDLELDFHNWYSVIYLGLYFGLSYYFGNGQTLGKRLMKIRAVSLVHHRMSLWHSFERALGYGASLLELGFGFFQFFIEPNRRTVHDRIAETIVVKEPRVRTKSHTV